MGSLLDAAVDASGGRAELVWVDPQVVEDAGIAAWTELPIWLPPTGDAAGLHDGDVSAAYAAGLDCRPVERHGPRHLGLAAGRGLAAGQDGPTSGRARPRP